MSNLSSKFIQFHDRIKLGRFKENAVLQDKRNIIREKIERNLPDIFKRHNEEVPKWEWKNQGSYRMDTGVKPLKGDYDIDQGLYFKVSKDDWNPFILKKRVYEALHGHTRDVKIRRPCVTVCYQRNDEPIYHVDIAVYSSGEFNSDGKDYLAYGRESDADADRKWGVSSPQGLIDKLKERFKDDDKKQFKRIIRYLKRWKDIKFSADGNAAPLGIGLTVCAYYWLRSLYIDQLANGKNKPDDHRALLNLVNSILAAFAPVYCQQHQRNCRRIRVDLPVEPWNDLFEQMTCKQCQDFEDKLKLLLDALQGALDQHDPYEACRLLQRQFGEDWPECKKEETARTTGPAISSSGHAA